MPDGVDGPALNKMMRTEYNTVLAGGQGPLTGKIFRIGHLGLVQRGGPAGLLRRAQARAAARRVRAGGSRRALSRSIIRRTAKGTRGCRARARFVLVIAAPTPKHARRYAVAQCMKKILVADPIAQDGIDILKREAEVDVRTGLSPDELIGVIAEYDALVVRSETKVTAEVFAAGKQLQVVGRAGVGVDNIDLNAATERGVVVVNAPLGNTISAAEHTIGADAGARAPHPGGERVAEGRRVEARRSSSAWSCAARRWASSGSARSARRWRGAARGST